MTIHKGTIRGFSGSWHSGIAFLFIEDPDSGILPVPCNNARTVKALEDCFGKVIGPGHMVDDVNGNHLGQEVFWSYDEIGSTLGGFTPVENAGPEILEVYKRGPKG